MRLHPFHCSACGMRWEAGEDRTDDPCPFCGETQWRPKAEHRPTMPAKPKATKKKPEPARTIGSIRQARIEDGLRRRGAKP